jgi:hypothetical protein
LSSAIQRVTEPTASTKAGIESAVSEARLLLQSLSSLLLLFARQHEWSTATSIIEEITILEPRSALRHNDAASSGGYPAKFEELMSLTCYGLHASLVDLAVQDDTAPISNDLASLIEATLPSIAFDLHSLLEIYSMAKEEADADASWSWGWEPEPVSGVGFFPRANEILIRGFVAIVIAWPERAIFQDSDAWRSIELGKLEQAAGGASELGQLLRAGGQLDKILRDSGEIAKLVAATGQNQTVADRAVAALRKLLDYVQTKTADKERERIRSAQVPEATIQSYLNALVEQYDTGDQPKTVILERMGLLSTDQQPPSTAEEHGSFGFNTLDPKQWFIDQESETWTQVGKEYADGLHKGEQKAIIEWLSRISLPIELSSVLAHESHVEESKGILVVNSSVYFLPPSLETSVKISESANPGHEDPNAFLEISRQRIPMYEFFDQGLKSCLLFIHSSSSARAIRIPWKPEDGWTLSKTGEVKARLRVPSQDASAMNELLGQHASWLEEKAHTDEEKRAYLSGLVWLQAYLQFALHAGATPNTLRLDLPPDEPDVLPKTNDTLDGNASK